ncbi:SH3 domain-containing protein [Helicobacter sp. WB40]|uniref:SH3 domain-containing protein n=1 Tax=Helicobacter sp. WB40 TaxID=3004130 RepID=UPI0022EBFC3D|nr:SH3 domain-containing protein [Helicobacter sp. WB40]MDA3966397.1 SH3 domain-containing protein [Helicobacter sp. WB40]
MKIFIYFLFSLLLYAQSDVSLDSSLTRTNDTREQQEAIQSNELTKEIKELIYNSSNQNNITSEANSTTSIQNNAVITKHIYLNVVNFSNDILYVNQIIPIDFKMLVFGDYSTIKTEFIVENDSVAILNPQENWILEPDSSLKNTFYFQIKQTSYSIPKLKVTINTSDGEFTESTDFMRGKAIKLDRKGRYSQVIANDLRILDTKITTYDSENNLAVFQLASKVGNLFDFYLDNYSQQGIESKDGNYKESVAFYYVIVPKSLGVISFDYFNTQQSKYVELQVENIPHDERVSTQSDIKPKNNLQFFKVSIILFLLLIFIGLYFYKRKVIFIVAFVALLVVLFVVLSSRSEAVLKANIPIRIQPTFNSTIIMTTNNVLEVKILDDKRGYYKVLLDDDRIGWVKKNDVQN